MYPQLCAAVRLFHTPNGKPQTAKIFKHVLATRDFTLLEPLAQAWARKKNNHRHLPKAIDRGLANSDLIIGPDGLPALAAPGVAKAARKPKKAARKPEKVWKLKVKLTQPKTEATVKEAAQPAAAAWAQADVKMESEAVAAAPYGSLVPLELPFPAAGPRQPRSSCAPRCETGALITALRTGWAGIAACCAEQSCVCFGPLSAPERASFCEPVACIAPHLMWDVTVGADVAPELPVGGAVAPGPSRLIGLALALPNGTHLFRASLRVVDGNGHLLYLQSGWEQVEGVPAASAARFTTAAIVLCLHACRAAGATNYACLEALAPCYEKVAGGHARGSYLFPHSAILGVPGLSTAAARDARRRADTAVLVHRVYANVFDAAAAAGVVCRAWGGDGAGRSVNVLVILLGLLVLLLLLLSRPVHRHYYYYYYYYYYYSL